MKSKAVLSSISTKITVLMCAMVLLSSSVIGVFSYFLYRGDSIKDHAKEVLSIAQSVSAIYEPEGFKEIVETKEKTEYWHQKKAAVDKIKKNTGVLYLYVLDANYTDVVTYVMEGYDPLARPEEAELDLGYTENILDENGETVYADEMMETIKTGKDMTTDIYMSGDFGAMVSGFSAISDSSGKVIGVVGVDMAIGNVLRNSNAFRLRLIFIVLAFTVVFAFLIMWLTRRMIGAPIRSLTAAARKISQGDVDVQLPKPTDDEIGELSSSFKSVVDATGNQVAVLEALAAGDLTENIVARSEADAMSLAIKNTMANLNSMLHDINTSTSSVSSGSKQIADGAQMLAQSSIEQAGEVEQLTREIADIAEKTRSNVEMAERAASLSDNIKHTAEEGSRQMKRMMDATKDIADASQSIGQVIKVIDDIAFQTNILALNAAVEAARAGQHGKGFAVVAEEVRNLAGKSAEAARNTSELIENSMQKAELGAKIADETAESLAKIVDGVNESSRIVAEIPKTSNEQSQAISRINEGINHVASIVHQNSATAEQSAAASEEMNGQADMLNGLVARFKLSDK